MTFPLFPPQASQVAARTDLLFWGLVSVSGLAMLVVFGCMGFFLFRYRRGSAADRSPWEIPEWRLEVVWTLLPTAIFMGFFAWGAVTYATIQRVPPGGLEINVVGKQWMWKIQHPDGHREINELHVPAGQVIKLTLASQDVIHSFFLPEFRIKQDAVPGRYTTEWFKAERAGTYHLFCSEYCGTEHSGMTGRVVVMKPAEYSQWLARTAPAQTLAQAGEERFRALGCSGCHVNSKVIHAPPLEGLFGSPAPLESGEIVVADESYLRDSILLPSKQIARGYANEMPSYQGRLDEEQLLELVAYLKFLGRKPRLEPDAATPSPP